MGSLQAKSWDQRNPQCPTRVPGRRAAGSRADGEGIAGALGEVGHHVLDACVLQQGMPSPLPTVPALLHPTEGCLGGGAAVGVHPDGASLDRAGEPVSPREAPTSFRKA